MRPARLRLLTASALLAAAFLGPAATPGTALADTPRRPPPQAPTANRPRPPRPARRSARPPPYAPGSRPPPRRRPATTCTGSSPRRHRRPRHRPGHRRTARHLRPRRRHHLADRRVRRLRRRQACRYGSDRATLAAAASTVQLTCHLRTVRGWAEPWSNDPLPGAYHVRLTAVDLGASDIGLPFRAALDVSLDEAGSAADTDGRLAAPRAGIRGDGGTGRRLVLRLVVRPLAVDRRRRRPRSAGRCLGLHPDRAAAAAPPTGPEAPPATGSTDPRGGRPRCTRHTGRRPRARRLSGTARPPRPRTPPRSPGASASATASAARAPR